MDSTQHWRESMQQIGTLLDFSRETLTAAGDPNDWQPSSDAHVHEELDHKRRAHGVRSALESARGVMVVAQEGMRIHSSLLSVSPPAAFCPYPVARMTVEALSKAHWLYEPRIGADERSARGLIVLLNAALQRCRVAKTEEQRASVLAAVEAIEGIANKSGILLKKEAGMPSAVCNRSMPSKSRLVKLLFGDDDLGEGVYWTLSDISHANVLASLRNIDDQQGGPMMAVYESDVRQLAAAVLEAWWQTTDRLVCLMGWKSTNYDERRRHIQSNVKAMLEPLL